MSSRRHMQVTGNEVHPRVCHAARTCVHANSLLDLNSQKWLTQFVRCRMHIVLDHMQTALDTGGGKESLYINIPYAPPPTSVQGLCKTLAKRRCVELPRGALKWVPCNLTKFCILYFLVNSCIVCSMYVYNGFYLFCIWFTAYQTYSCSTCIL